MTKQADLIKKYNVPVPRYTSYPTVPVWNKQAMPAKNWQTHVQRIVAETNADKGISLYIHLPYCESLCHYCACTKIITKKHDKVEGPYVQAVLNEWEYYLRLFTEKPVIRELHLGGGTPTFFSPQHLRQLIGGILATGIVPENHHYSFEGHPNTTSYEHLQVLYELGFDRISLGVQDFSPQVQKAINREQNFERVKELTTQARALGYQSVNYDLIFGLPFQTLDSIRYTMELMGKLMPDRLAFYSYAHLPWKEKSQRVFSEADLPGDAEKRALYEKGREYLEQLGYHEIGMDHFALPGDELFKALEARRLHRNFMGFTTTQTDLLLGLGVSAISDARYAYAQNTKSVNTYIHAVNQGQLAQIRGYELSEDDLLVKGIILELMCQLTLTWQPAYNRLLTSPMKQQLATFEQEGLITRQGNNIRVSEAGRPFIRNISAVFDQYLQKKQGEKPRFSQSI